MPPMAMIGTSSMNITKIAEKRRGVWRTASIIDRTDNPFICGGGTRKIWIPKNPDVVAAIGTNPEALRTHFLEHGWLENRKGYGLPYEDDNTRAKGMIFDVAAQITNDSMTDREKIKAVHDWIVHHTNYDKENYDRGTIPDESGHIEGVMVKGIAVCNGYAETFDCFMYVLGIEHEMVDGWADGSTPNGRHAWLYVDCTWDDLSHQVGKDVIRYNYFLCTESEIAQDHTARDSYKVY